MESIELVAANYNDLETFLYQDNASNTSDAGVCKVFLEGRKVPVKILIAV